MSFLRIVGNIPPNCLTNSADCFNSIWDRSLLTIILTLWSFQGSGSGLTRNISMIALTHLIVKHFFNIFFQNREKALLSCDSFINIPPIIPIVKHKIRIFLIIFSDCSGRLRSPYIYNRKKPAKRPHLRFCRLTIWRVAFLESERLCICTKTIWKFKVKKVNITWKNTILYSAILLTISLFLVYNISVP